MHPCQGGHLIITSGGVGRRWGKEHGASTELVHDASPTITRTEANEPSARADSVHTHTSYTHLTHDTL